MYGYIVYYVFAHCLTFPLSGAMQNASALVTDRVVFYKHRNANFYSAAPFVFGRSLSQLPQVCIVYCRTSTLRF
jgi:hypothetical protein